MGKTESVLDTGYHNEHAEAGASKEGDIGGTCECFVGDAVEVRADGIRLFQLHTTERIHRRSIYPSKINFPALAFQSNPTRIYC
jgi:hypothetical protein